MLRLVAAAERGHLRLFFADLSLHLHHLRRPRHARQREQPRRRLPREKLELRAVGLDFQPLRLRRRHLGIELLEPLADDVLLLFERNGLVLFLVTLESLLGTGERHLEALGLLPQKLVRALRNLGAGFGTRAHEFAHHELRDLLRQRRALVLHRKIDQPRPWPRLHGDFRRQNPLQLGVGREAGDLRAKFRILRQLRMTGEAQHERGILEILLDRLEGLVGGPVIHPAVVGPDEPLPLLLDLDGGRGRVNFFAPRQIPRGGQHPDGGDGGQQPGLFPQGVIKRAIIGRKWRGFLVVGWWPHTRWDSV